MPHAPYTAAHRRRLPSTVLAVMLLVLPCAVSAKVAAAFGFNDVAARAEKLAAQPYSKPVSNLPEEIRLLNYDQYRDIRYRPERSHWRDDKLPFELAFFHQGLYFEQPVKINEITAKGVREIRFDPELFDYGKNRIDPKNLQHLGFAGFRVHYPINTPTYKDEVAVFLGASYFRAIGKDQHYGLSARGLAVDTALSSGEEFPRFAEYWVQRPARNAKELVIYALLDSPRVAGAYRFVLQPGTDTVMEVKARLYTRENIAKIGIAPLTSMFFSGENQRSHSEDYRPEVHDSDGLSVQAGTGEWLWRPLVNPRRLLVTSFAAINPQGFGLMQRDRNFRSYEDLEARYEMRPSAWIEPKGSWGAGRVELVQIPTRDETNDNIVTYWVPDQPPRPGQPYDIEYRLLWQGDPMRLPPLSWVTQTRRGGGYQKEEKTPDNTTLVIDFEGPALRSLPPDAQVYGVVSLDANAKLLEANAFRHAVNGGWRLVVRMRRLDINKPAELRAYLKSGNQTLSETWSYILPPG